MNDRDHSSTSGEPGREDHPRTSSGDHHRSTLDHDQPLSAVAGVLTAQVARDLSRPLRRLRELLAMTLDSVERHISRAQGPDPYPWKELQVLRQELADAYLLSRETARIAGELAEVACPDDGAGALRPVDVNRQVEAALALLHHRLQGNELFVDLGSVPPVRAHAGSLALVVAKLLLCCADSAAAAPGSAVSVRTRYAHEDGEDVVIISIADNGAGIPDAAESARNALEPVMSRLGGSFDGVSEPGRGCAFECRFPRPARP